MAKVADSVIMVDTEKDKSFFIEWFRYLEPLHHLTEKEIEVIAAFARHRYELGKAIKDDNILDKYLFSEETKRQIRSELNISTNHFQVIMVKFKKNGVFIDGKINKKLLPNLGEDATSYKLMLYFKL